MGLFGSIESHFKSDVSKVEAKVAALVPQSLKDEFGTYAHALVSSIVYDAKQLGIQVEQLSQPLIEQMVTAIKGIASSAFASVATGTPFATALATAVSQAKNEAVTTLVPGLKVIGETTLKNAMTMAGQLVVTGVVAANPTGASPSTPVSSSAGSSQASPTPVAAVAPKA